MQELHLNDHLMSGIILRREKYIIVFSVQKKYQFWRNTIFATINFSLLVLDSTAVHMLKASLSNLTS